MSGLLIVEDDSHVRTALGIALRARGYQVATAVDGSEARRAVTADMPDLVILDLGLPDVDGIEVLRWLRERTRAPVIVLSARSDRYDKIRALDAGADDYVTKPFDFEELVARIRSALRRATPAPEATTLRCRDFIIDMARKEVRLADGTDVRLTPTEWAFLEVLASSPGMAVGGTDLLRAAWGPGYEHHTNYLRVYAAQLRKKLEPDPAHPRHIITIPGVGYRLDLTD